MQPAPRYRSAKSVGVDSPIRFVLASKWHSVTVINRAADFSACHSGGRSESHERAARSSPQPPQSRVPGLADPRLGPLLPGSKRQSDTIRFLHPRVVPDGHGYGRGEDRLLALDQPAQQSRKILHLLHRTVLRRATIAASIDPGDIRALRPRPDLVG